MGSRIILLSALLVFSIVAKGQEDSIRNVFAEYKAAILKDRGEDAANVIDSRTIEYYAKMCQLALYGQKKEVQGLPIIDRIMVLGIRHVATVAEIISFDGYKMFVFAVNRGMVGKSSVADNTLGTVTIDGDFATAQHLSKGTVTPLFFHFYRENSVWKLNLTEMMPLLGPMLEDMIAEQSSNENKYLLELLEILYGRNPGNSPWKPMVKK